MVKGSLNVSYLDDLRALLREGKTYRECEKVLGLDHSSLHRAIRRHGMGEVESSRCTECGHRVTSKKCRICATRAHQGNRSMGTL